MCIADVFAAEFARRGSGFFVSVPSCWYFVLLLVDELPESEEESHRQELIGEEICCAGRKRQRPFLYETC